MNEVAVRETNIMVLPEQIDLIRRTVAKDATPDELELYFYDCKRQGVHPLDKLIHFTKRDNRYVPITAIDFMRMKAASTQEYAGSDDAVYSGTPGVKGFEAKITVYRMVQGQRCSWSATARWDEYYPGERAGHMWRKMPHVMLAKCAEALALRKGFADVLHGLHIEEELHNKQERARDTRSLKEKVQAKIVAVEPVKEPEVVEPDKPENGPVTQLPPAAVAPPQAQDSSGPNAAFVWRIGKDHKNESVTTIPSEYLEWYVREGKLGDHIDAALMELDRRNAQQVMEAEDAMPQM
jgi:phage recombination protein Bet